MICVSYDDNCMLYDKESMEIVESTKAETVKLIEDGKITNAFIFGGNGEVGFASYTASFVSGVFRGNTYFAIIGKYTVSDHVEDCNTVIEYYENDKRYTMRLYLPVSKEGVCRLVLGGGSDKVELYRCRCSSMCILPLKDGLYLFSDGNLVYEVKDLPDSFAENYSTSKKIKEVMLG